MDTAEMIRFPQERVRATWRIMGEERDPCLILILPVVRIERENLPLLGDRQTRRCRRSIDHLRGLKARQSIFDEVDLVDDKESK